MERSRTPEPSGRLIATALMVICALPLASCGRQEDFANKPRPPAPINVSAYVSSDGISVSPEAFGGGPVVITVANQSESSQDITLEGDGPSDLAQSTGPINPGGTGQIKVLVEEGTYTLRTVGAGIEPATVSVGARRESAQDRVLQP